MLINLAKPDIRLEISFCAIKNMFDGLNDDKSEDFDPLTGLDEYQAELVTSRFATKDEASF